MKSLFLILTVVFTMTVAQGQITNGSFENGSGADLSYWEWTCGAQSYNSAPAEGGNWCIQVMEGNYQGCFPGYAYQKLPSITNGQTFILSGWGYSQTSIGLYFGKISNGTITLQAGDTTSTNSWTQLSIQSSFSLSIGDTAVVILFGGIAGGPVQVYGYFDLINLQQVSGINFLEHKQTVEIFPNPFHDQTVLHTDIFLDNATLTLNNCLGETVARIQNINGQTVVLNRNNLVNGLYFVHLTQDNQLITTKKIIITD